MGLAFVAAVAVGARSGGATSAAAAVQHARPGLRGAWAPAPLPAVAAAAVPRGRVATRVGPTMETLVWAPVGSADGLVGGTTVPFEAVGLSLTLVPTDDGELFVVSGKCPPTGLPLEGADVDSEAKTVSCPQFGTRWSLETGEVVGQWMPSPPVVSSVLRLLFREPEGILTYPVRLTADSKIEVLVDADAKADFEKRYWKGVLDASGKANGGYY